MRISTKPSSSSFMWNRKGSRPSNAGTACPNNDLSKQNRKSVESRPPYGAVRKPSIASNSPCDKPNKKATTAVAIPWSWSILEGPLGEPLPAAPGVRGCAPPAALLLVAHLRGVVLPAAPLGDPPAAGDQLFHWVKSHLFSRPHLPYREHFQRS